MPVRQVVKSEVKRIIDDRLLMGKIVRSTSVGVRQLPCCSVRVPLNEFSVFLKKYFAYHRDIWVYDATGRAKLGDFVLIRKMTEPLTVKVCIILFVNYFYSNFKQ